MANINSAKYIWFCPNDKSRNPYAAFRKTFEITDAEKINNANFNIFADTNYKLYINGAFLGFGPARFDPRYPQYDTYDLLPYLKNGKNAIAALANFHGHKTFKNVPMAAAMIAWGQAGEIDLSTNGQNWKCGQYAAHTRYTPKLSFALNAQIYYDQDKFDEKWISSDYDDSNWKNAEEIENQNCFGELLPREIPFMSMEKFKPATKTRIFPLDENEDLYSFFIELPYTLDTTKKQTKYKDFVEWATYIYSPCEQDIVSATLYETVFANGAVCEPKFEDDSKPLRWNFAMHLEEGWNEISGSVKIYQDIYENYLALPKNKGLELSADKQKNSGNLFKHTVINLKEEGKEWVYSTKKEKAESPCREASWDSYKSSLQSIEPDKLNGFVFKKSLYPDGFALIFNLEHMHLAFPNFEFKGTRGAKIDLLYSDRYMPDGKHVRQQSWIPLGDRLSCSGKIDGIKWSPLQPRGFKYLNITVRNTSGDVTLENMDFISAGYPAKKNGNFECSDPALNNIWKMCALTQSVNMEDAYDDCVDRERGLYVLDTLIQYHNNLVCFGDHKLMKRSLELYAQSIHPKGQYRCLYPNTGDYVLPDFSLYAVEGFYSYYLYTGDKDLILAWWDSIMTNMNVFAALSDLRSDCLLDADPPDKSNPDDRRTGHLGDGGCTNNRGINCIFSCLYLIVLRGAQFLAKETNKQKDYENMSKRIKILEKSIPETFWGEEKGLFSDNAEMKYFSPHASLFAVRAGVASEDKLAVLQKNLEALLVPFFKNGYDAFGGVAFTTSYAYYMLDAMYKAGMCEIAESCMKEGWGWILSKGLKTTPEHFNLQESNCHAWTASPAYIMSRYILGVNFDIKKGLNEVVLDVKATKRIKWAKGVFPHPLGDIEIGWHRGENGEIIFDKTKAPKGVNLEITYSRFA
ncbi:MAG: hypothetical protein FWG34_06730 [Oscillospiraceae bacterium]|nr:hypothetical protein [Oscillospiraceae bacterium]